MSEMGSKFIFDGIPSENYGVSIVFLDTDYTNRPSGSGKTFITENIKRNAKQIYLDATQDKPLEFDIDIVFDNPVDIFDLTQVKDWLSGPLEFKKLQICAENFENFYYNCWIELGDDLIYNGGYRGVTAKIHCDAPWAWQFERTDNYDCVSGSKKIIPFNNLSADSETLRPKISFTNSVGGGYFCLEDVMYDFSGNIIHDRTTIFGSTTKISYKQENGETVEYNPQTNTSPLQVDETITFDSLSGIIESSSGVNRVSNFNKVFVKIPKGGQKFIMTGNATNMKLIYTNAKRIGGGYY